MNWTHDQIAALRIELNAARSMLAACDPQERHQREERVEALASKLAEVAADLDEDLGDDLDDQAEGPAPVAATTSTTPTDFFRSRIEEVNTKLRAAQSTAEAEALSAELWATENNLARLLNTPQGAKVTEPKTVRDGSDFNSTPAAMVCPVPT
jgi:hypothetical protein